MQHYRPTWVEISKRAFSKNLRRLKKVVGTRTKILAVLKADAYGHGAQRLAREAIKNGAWGIGVSSLEEGIELRGAGIRSRILVLGGLYPLKNFSVAYYNRLTPTIASLNSAKALNQFSKKIRKPVSCHLKIDTGMGRIGVTPAEGKRILSWLKNHPNVVLEGVYTHFPSADNNAPLTLRQMAELKGIQTHASKLQFPQPLFHCANSAACLRFKEAAMDMVRPGLILYGLSPLGKGLAPQFSPVLSWHTKVIFLKKVPRGQSISYGETFKTKRPSEIATLPVGYADGVPRRTSNKGFVLIKGKKCPIVGRVTMDQIMVDVTAVRIKIGEPAVLIGRQKSAQLTANDWAQWAQTNSYEILCGISKRVPRVEIN